MLKVINKSTETNYGICSKSRRKTTEQYHWRRSWALTINFKHVLYLALLFWLLHAMPAGIEKVFQLLSNKMTRAAKPLEL